jgi:hypothetical protein
MSVLKEPHGLSSQKTAFFIELNFTNQSHTPTSGLSHGLRRGASHRLAKPELLLSQLLQVSAECTTTQQWQHCLWKLKSHCDLMSVRLALQHLSYWHLGTIRTGNSFSHYRCLLGLCTVQLASNFRAPWDERFPQFCYRVINDTQNLCRGKYFRKNAVFRKMTPCGSCKNRRFGVT